MEETIITKNATKTFKVIFKTEVGNEENRERKRYDVATNKHIYVLNVWTLLVHTMLMYCHERNG